MEFKFKIGDKVEIPLSNECNSHYNGKTGVISNIDSTINPYEVVFDSGGSGWVREVKLIGKEKKGKTKPTTLHLLMETNCMNVVNVVNSFNEAVENAKESSNKQTIYELVKVADIESVRKVSKVKKTGRRKWRCFISHRICFISDF